MATLVSDHRTLDLCVLLVSKHPPAHQEFFKNYSVKLYL